MKRHCRANRRDLIAFAVVATSLFGLKFIRAQTPNSDKDEAAIIEARGLLAHDDAEQAADVMEKLLKSHPKNVSALTLLAEARLQQGRIDEARGLLVSALQEHPKSAGVNGALGNLFLKEHHFPEAMDRFETVLRLTPMDVEARRGEFEAATELALSAQNSGHPEVALQVLQHACSAMPDDPKLLIAIGNQEMDLHLLREASDAFAAARKLDPEDAEVYYASGQLETEEQHLSAAEADFRAYLARQPKDATAHFGLGHVLSMEQRPEEARTEFERSIQLQPVQTESYYQIGQIELDHHHDLLAEPLFRKTLERDPTHGGALTGMGVLAYRAQDFAKAEQYLATAEKTAPDYGPAHYYRGLSLTRLGRKAEADAELQKAIEQNKTVVDTKQDDAPAVPTAH